MAAPLLLPSSHHQVMTDLQLAHTVNMVTDDTKYQQTRNADIMELRSMSKKRLHAQGCNLDLKTSTSAPSKVGKILHISFPRFRRSIELSPKKFCFIPWLLHG